MAAVASVTRTDSYRVYVHIDSQKAWINGGPTLPASVRSRILCDSTVLSCVITGGTPISVGRVTRVIPPHTRRVVLDRDVSCRYPGCNRRQLEIHHIIHWEHGGRTDTENLAGFCSYHHHRKHDGTFDVTGNADEPDGLIFTRPDGSTIQTGPQPIAPFGPLPSPPPGHRYNHPTGERIQEKWVHFNKPAKVA